MDGGDGECILLITVGQTTSINGDFIEKQLVQIQWLKCANNYPLQCHRRTANSQLIFTAVDAHLFGKGITVKWTEVLYCKFNARTKG